MITAKADGAQASPGRSSRTRSVAMVGLTVAIVAVSAWVVVPFGPIPFTLQTFALVFAIMLLSPAEATAAIAIYLLLGALGAPVFSGMRGGIGVLAGPTGGFLWGFMIGVPVAAYLLRLLRKDGVRTEAVQVAGQNRIVAFLKSAGVEVAMGVLFMAISYACGTVQYMAVANMGLPEAFATCCAPFLVVDAVKIVAAVLVAQQVRRAVR